MLEPTANATLSGCGSVICGSLQGRLTLLRPWQIPVQHALGQQWGQDTSADVVSHVAVPPAGPAQLRLHGSAGWVTCMQYCSCFTALQPPSVVASLHCSPTLRACDRGLTLHAAGLAPGFSVCVRLYAPLAVSRLSTAQACMPPTEAGCEAGQSSFRSQQVCHSWSFSEHCTLLPDPCRPLTRAPGRA